MQRPIATFSGSAASPDQFPKDGLPEVAFLGRSNVGKSSLLNALAGVKSLARVSAEPGRTRLVNFFRVGNDLYLSDLPGYGYARVPEAMRVGWERLVVSYLQDREPLALCIFLVDARHAPTPGDLTLRGYLDHHGLPYALVATKADKLGRGELTRSLGVLAQGFGQCALDVAAVSAKTGAGVDGLWRIIKAAVDSHRERRHGGR